MMKNIYILTRTTFFLCLCISTLSNLYSQPFFPVKVNGLWGAIDASGKIVIQPKYHDRMVACGSDNQYLVNEYNDTVRIINSKFEETILTAISLSAYMGDELFAFKKDTIRFGLEGLMDYTGKIIIPAKFEMIYPFVEGVAKVTYCTGVEKNKVIIKEGMIDLNGKLVIQPTFDKGFLEECSGGVIRFRDNSGKWGVMDKTGKIVVQPKYDYLGPCRYGYMMYRLIPNFNRTGLMTINEQVIIADDGNTLVNYLPSCETDTLLVVGKAQNGMFQKAVYTLHGTKLFDSKYPGILHHSYGTFNVMNADRLYGIIDSKGNDLVPFFFSGILK
jgi:hypothetical protein